MFTGPRCALGEVDGAFVFGADGAIDELPAAEAHLGRKRDQAAS